MSCAVVYGAESAVISQLLPRIETNRRLAASRKLGSLTRRRAAVADQTRLIGYLKRIVLSIMTPAPARRLTAQHPSRRGPI